jgi:serine protease inhibitor
MFETCLLQKFKIEAKVRGIWHDYFLSYRNHVTGILDDLTRLVLVNAVYFKGLWQSQFNAANTVPDEFHLSSRESKKVPMMRKTDDFGYLRSKKLDADILEMPYKVGPIYAY